MKCEIIHLNSFDKRVESVLISLSNDDNVFTKIFSCQYIFLPFRHQQEISCINKKWLEQYKANYWETDISLNVNRKPK